MRERTVEGFLVEEVEATGGLAIKIGHSGWHDRLIVVDGVSALVECKRPGETLRELQKRRHEAAVRAGAISREVSTLGQARALVQELRHKARCAKH